MWVHNQPFCTALSAFMIAFLVIILKYSHYVHFFKMLNFSLNPRSFRLWLAVPEIAVSPRTGLLRELSSYNAVLVLK